MNRKDNVTNLASNNEDSAPLIRPIFRHRERRIQIPLEIDNTATMTLSDGNKAVGTIVDISIFGAKLQFEGADLYLSQNNVMPVCLVVSGQKIFDGSARIVTEKAVERGTNYGICFVDGHVDTDHVTAILSELEIKPKLSETKSIYAVAPKVKVEFKALVADLNTLYQDLRVRLNEEEKHIEASAASEQHKNRLKEHAINLAVSLYSKDFSELFAEFDKLVSSFSPEDNLIHKRYFRANFSALVSANPFMKRALEKPLGYSGDYGLMVMFYDYQDLGETLFDKFHHRLACNQPSAVANKNRIDYLSHLIQTDYMHRNAPNYKISSLACGPARELFQFVNDTTFKPKSNMKFVLADQEPLALEHASHTIRKSAQKKVDIEISCLKEDVVLGTIKRKPFTAEFENSDLIISAGLFDYLSDRVASKLIEVLIEYLAPKGELIIGNVSDRSPDRFSMDYFMEWNLLLRSPDQLLELVPEHVRKSSSYKCEVSSESLGLNLFLRIQKRA